MLREVEANFAPEFSTLMVRDAFQRRLRSGIGEHSEQGMVDPPPPPRDYPEDAQPCGTMGRSGAGFLDAPASGEDQTVRLQLHDGPPPDDRADWTSVLRTPYWSRSGSVSLEFVTGGAVSPALDLGGPGRYGVCVARRGESPDVEWRLRFWADSSSTVDLPKWLVRPGPATRPLSDGWEDLLGWPAQELVGIVRSMSRERGGAGVSIQEVDTWGVEHHRSVGWLDAPLDAEAATVAEIADQLRIAVPSSRRGLVGVLVVAGVLDADDDGRMRPGHPEPAVDVLTLPATRSRILRAQRDRRSYTAFATDLLSLAVWAPTDPYVTTVDDLADRLQATEREIMLTLSWAMEQGLLIADVTERGAPVRLSVGPGKVRPGPGRS